MIELNLLPDVKQEYIRAERSRRLVISVTFIVTAASVGLLLLLLSVTGLQKKNINDLSNDIDSSVKVLKKKPQIAKILTVQNQLMSLSGEKNNPGLHDKKTNVSSFFTYLNQVTPANVDITSLEANFTDQTATITGNADSLSSVNKYIDTLKFTTYTTEGDQTASPAFSNIVLSSFAISGGASNNSGVKSKPATYTINLNYDPAILDITKTTTLVVPKQTTTRSTSGSPNDLFNAGAGGN